VRILLWHGYLLGGTGSNVYTRALAREWSRAGHDVVVVCQEREPEQYDLGGAQVVRPELPGRLLPTFVLDRYAGLHPILLQDMSRQERDAYVAANGAALRDLLPADIVFANHVLLGAPVGVAAGVPFRVKAHGSELEYSMRGRPDLERWGAETLGHAEVTYVGSVHIREVLEEVVGQVDRVAEVPPGVDVDKFVLEDRDTALAALLDESRKDPPNPGNAEERLPDEGNAARFAEFFAADRPTVVYFGKLIEQKGVQILLEAMADVDARLVVVGFGPYRPTLEALALPGTLFTGPLEHRHLVHLLPLADVTVVPSIFPEAFGMVAAEAAAAGSPPLVANHSGLAEVAAGLEASYPERLRGLASFQTGDARDLAAKLNRILDLSPADHDELRRAGRRAVVDHWSWASVAERLLEPPG
jgi:glycosyltransferase involved in cell wall biosynthesis